MKKVLPFLLPLVAALPLALNLYAAWWAVQYRLPPVCANQFVDRRGCESEPPYYVTFCAALANNPHGFPGHAVVIWSKTADWNRADAETSGFVPSHSLDQFASLFTYVPGTMVHGRSKRMINPDAITVIVGKEEFEKTRRMRDAWNAREFRTGVRDCVAFMDYIAQEVGLLRPLRSFDFPQDHVKQLKKLNNKTASSLARSNEFQTRTTSDCSSDLDHADQNKNDTAD